ncbi:MAG: peptide-binding protein [Chloroherpetonaceae bacterium]|nr:peptide-binding protein [Chloroherpetonaceae bacterium]
MPFAHFALWLRTCIAVGLGALLTLSCQRQPERARSAEKPIVVALANDLDHLNPLLIQLSISREVCIQVFPKLVQAEFDETAGTVRYLPCLATRWEFSPDGRQATFYLRSDARWDDGYPITAADLKFSYQLYAHPAVASTRQQYVQDLVRDAQGNLDFERGVQTPNDTTLILTFQKPLAPMIVLDHFYDLMPVAKHIFEKIDPKELRTKAAELPIVGGGPFKVEKWERQKQLVLVSNPTSVLPHPAKVQRLIFRIIPEYTTRLTAFKAGDVDVLMSAGGISPKDTLEVLQNPALHILPVRFRSFNSIVWLNIDGEAYRTRGEIRPNFFFGDKRVRQAMTYGINRQAIAEGFMGKHHATVVNTSLSPAYSKFLNPSLHPYDFNPEKAKALLAEAGWTRGKSGLLEKDGKPFSFTLAYPAGNQRRAYAATIIQQNLKDLGIECTISAAEAVVFNENQNQWRYDAALSGLSAETLPFQLTIWSSDFKNTPFNSACFQNARLDSLCQRLTEPLPPDLERQYWYEYQAILHDHQPRTFLYYYDELQGFNKRIQNVKVSMLAVLINAHEWTLAALQ